MDSDVFVTNRQVCEILESRVKLQTRKGHYCEGSKDALAEYRTRPPEAQAMCMDNGNEPVGQDVITWMREWMRADLALLEKEE